MWLCIIKRTGYILLIQTDWTTSAGKVYTLRSLLSAVCFASDATSWAGDFLSICCYPGGFRDSASELSWRARSPTGVGWAASTGSEESVENSSAVVRRVDPGRRAWRGRRSGR